MFVSYTLRYWQKKVKKIKKKFSPIFVAPQETSVSLFVFRDVLMSSEGHVQIACTPCGSSIKSKSRNT